MNCLPSAAKANKTARMRRFLSQRCWKCTPDAQTCSNTKTIMHFTTQTASCFSRAGCGLLGCGAREQPCDVERRSKQWSAQSKPKLVGLSTPALNASAIPHIVSM
ncbi:hypothetical protein CEP54_016324 [Fusarium duplospermum]|uniref:Uncharacterized protein n=1 Tax=Fusarium duplospermum TaxID=1325734 RepID=A0A428NF72_9HYPO|nr:hypothetical protein CEP54_016324 [Fusarium duplospermum]